MAEFCEKLRVASSDFSMMKDIVAALAWFSSFPIKLFVSVLLILFFCSNQLQ